MADIIPPLPSGVPPGSSFWNRWAEELRRLVNDLADNVVAWTGINFSGSSITDIQSRPHNNLQSFQGGAAGEYFHLTTVQHSRVTTIQSKAGFPTTSDIANNQWAIYKDTSGGSLRLWANDGGTLRSVTLT